MIATQSLSWAEIILTYLPRIYLNFSNSKKKNKLYKNNVKLNYKSIKMRHKFSDKLYRRLRIEALQIFETESQISFLKAFPELLLHVWIVQIRFTQFSIAFISFSLKYLQQESNYSFPSFILEQKVNRCVLSGQISDCVDFHETIISCEIKSRKDKKPTLSEKNTFSESSVAFFLVQLSRGALDRAHHE